MSQLEIPATHAIRFLRKRGISFVPHHYTHEEHGGTSHAAASLDVPEHLVIKTLVMQTDEKHPFLVLMHGDREVSTKRLARALGFKQVLPCDANTAQRHTGYLVGGISPFGTRRRLPVYAELTIFSLRRVYVNGGKRGFLVELSPMDIRQALNVVPVETAIPG